LTQPDDCGRFVEACTHALAIWDSRGLWGHFAEADDGYQGHSRDRVQSLAGPFVGVWQIVDRGKPAFAYLGQPDAPHWFEE
jgi:hypothetical protein